MSFTRFNNSSSFKRFNQPDPSNPYDTASIDNQINNATMRIEDAGYTPEKADKRNWFEKLTNLPQGQNFFFDTLELLGRPGQALMNGIAKKNTGMGVGEALKRGFSGEDKVRGSDLLEGTNITNPLAKTIVGTGLEIALDPLTYVPGGVLAKGVTVPTKLAGKALGGAVKAVENTIPSFARFNDNVVRPAADGVKDGLGYMFKPDYKKTETLTGGQSDFLSNLERESENSRRFMKENYMTDLADTANTAGGIESGIDVGRLMEKDLQVNGPRPFREVSTDPNVTLAADKLIRSNAQLREFAKEKGIDIPELAGYMTHILTQEEKARRAAGKSFKIDVGRFGTGNPNKKILQKRNLEGSVEDINQQMGRNFFEPNAYFASGVGQQRLIDYIHSVDFRRKVLSNPDFAQKYENGMDVGKNIIIDSNNYKFLKESGDTLEGLNLADNIGGEYVVTPQVKMLLDRYQRINSDQGTKAFIKSFDALQSTWKKLALFSPGFHVRNMAGGMWNNYVTGMNLPQLIKYTQEGAREVFRAARGKESGLYREFREQGLGSTGQANVELGFTRDPESAIRKAVEQRSKDAKGKVVQRLNPLNAFQTSREAGDIVDQTNRFAVYKWSRDRGMSPQQAAEKVRETQFDYTQLTNVEQNVFRRIAPFYTWTRKNVPFQIKKFLEDPRKFQNINRLRLNAQENVGLNEENMPEFMKENFYTPLYGADGKGKMLALNLPLGDLTKLSNPLKMGTDMVSQLAKTPVEIATNYNMFKGKAIQQFEGQQKQLQLPGTDAKFGIPIKLSHAVESLGGQVGRGITNLLQPRADVDQDSKYRTPTLGLSFLKDFDAEANAYYERLNQLKQLQDLIRYIEQQEGEKPRTVNEINRGSR